MGPFQRILAFTTVLIWTRWLYEPSCECEFTFDDHLAVLNNEDVDTNKTSAAPMWHHDIWGKDLVKIDSHKSWRPLLTFSFRLSHAAEGGFATRPFHLPGIWLHALVSSMLVVLADTLLQDLEVSFFVGMLFASHPVHVEGVTSIVNRAEPMCAFFCLAARFVYSRLASHFPAMSATERPLPILWAFWLQSILKMICLGILFVLLFTCAVLSKETGLTVVAVLGCYDILREPPTSETGPMSNPALTLEDAGSSVRSDPQKSKWRERTFQRRNFSRRIVWHWGCFILRIAFMAALSIAYLLVRMKLMSTTNSSRKSSIAEFLADLLTNPFGDISWKSASLDTSGLIRRAENPFAFTEPGLPRVLSICYLHFRYAWLLLFPRNLSCEYSYNCVPAVVKVSDPRNLLSFITYSSFILLLFVGIKGVFVSRRRSKNPKNYNNVTDGVILRLSLRPGLYVALLEALAWGAFPFVPASMVFTTVGTLIAERLLYLPSLGYSLLLGWLILAIETALLPILPMKSLSQCNTSGHSNEDKRVVASENDRGCDKRDQQDQTQYGPQNQGNKAQRDMIRNTKSSKGDSWARSRWLRSLAWCMVATCATWTRRRIPDWHDDWTLFHAALRVCPTSAKTNNQVGQLWMGKNNPRKALEYYNRARAIDPQFCDVDFTMAHAYLALNDYSAAVHRLRKSLFCTYTSNGAFRDLQKVWSFLLSLDNSNATLHVEIAETIEDIISGAAAEVERDLQKKEKEKEKEEKKLLWRFMAFWQKDEIKKGSNMTTLNKTYIDEAVYRPTPLEESAANHFQTAGVLEFNRNRYFVAEELLARAISKDKISCEVKYWLARSKIGLAGLVSNDDMKHTSFRPDQARNKILTIRERLVKLDEATILALSAMNPDATFDGNFVDKYNPNLDRVVGTDSIKMIDAAKDTRTPFQDFFNFNKIKMDLVDGDCAMTAKPTTDVLFQALLLSVALDANNITRIAHVGRVFALGRRRLLASATQLALTASVTKPQESNISVSTADLHAAQREARADKAIFLNMLSTLHYIQASEMQLEKVSKTMAQKDTITIKTAKKYSIKNTPAELLARVNSLLNYATEEFRAGERALNPPPGLFPSIREYQQEIQRLGSVLQHLKSNFHDLISFYLEFASEAINRIGKGQQDLFAKWHTLTHQQPLCAIHLLRAKAISLQIFLETMGSVMSNDQKAQDAILRSQALLDPQDASKCPGIKTKTLKMLNELDN